MEPSAVIPNYDQTFPLKDSFRAFRRPSTLTVSSIASSKGRSPEPSPTRERFRRDSEIADEVEEGVVEGPFMYVGHKRRRFHVQRDSAPYPLPCGLEELSRMNMLHYVFYHVFGKKHCLTEFTTGELPKRVLDIGCGTGIWIYDVAKEWAAMGHKDVEFVGIDLVPIQSPMRDVNVKYHYLNILTDELPFEDGYFDYVHIRGLAAGVPENCWVGDHKTSSGVLDKAIRVLRVGGYFEVMEMNLLYSYFDTSFNPPKQLTSDLVFSKGDTIAPVLLKIYTGKQHNVSPTINLGINPYPVAILSAQFTFLPLTRLRTERHLIPFARFNVSMIRSEKNSNSAYGTSDDINDSVARLAGYVASGETYSSLKSELVRIIREQNQGDAYSEFKRIEQRSHRRWLGMELPDNDRSDSIMSDIKSIRNVRSGELSKPRSVNSGFSRSSRNFDVTLQDTEMGDAALDKGQLRREVCAWWGRKAAD